MKNTHISLLIAFALSWPVFLHASDKVVTPIFITESDELEYGAFSISRAYLANAIEKISDGEPKGIILKLFIDRPKDEEGDLLLAKSLLRTNVILQCRIDDTETQPNEFPERFYSKKRDAKFRGLLKGDKGWITLPMLVTNAFDLGFADIRSASSLPLFVQYKGKVAKSITLCGLEMAFGSSNLKISKNSLRVGDTSVQVSTNSNVAILFPKEDNLRFYSLSDLMNDKIPPERLKDRIVILGYDGPKIHALDTPIGKVKAHRVFCYGLSSLHDQLSR